MEPNTCIAKTSPLFHYILPEIQRCRNLVFASNGHALPLLTQENFQEIRNSLDIQQISASLNPSLILSPFTVFFFQIFLYTYIYIISKTTHVKKLRIWWSRCRDTRSSSSRTLMAERFLHTRGAPGLDENRSTNQERHSEVVKADQESMMARLVLLVTLWQIDYALLYSFRPTTRTLHFLYAKHYFKHALHILIH